MDIIAESFDVSAALKECGAEAAQLDKTLLGKLDTLKKSMDAGLKPDDFFKAKALESALSAARIIVNLSMRKGASA